MIESFLPPIHPGQFLSETIEELGIPQARLASAIGVSAMSVSHVVNGTSPCYGRIGASTWPGLRAITTVMAQPAIGL